MFDTDQFLTSVVTEKGSTERIVVPEGEYQATIHDLKIRPVQTKNGDRVILDVIWSIDDQTVCEVTKRDLVVCRQSIWLDFDADGKLDMSEGMNIDLNRLVEAVGLEPPWTPIDLKGRGAIVTVAHNVQKDRIYAEVKSARNSFASA